MGGSSNNGDTSFIPKRGPANRSKRGASKQLYVFTLVAYVLFFATLVASAGVFLYDRYIDQQLTNEVAALNEEINQFREADLEEVRLFDNRLIAASDRVRVATSLRTLFAAIEAATAETVQLTSLDLERVDDNYFAVDLSVETGSLDSSIFQRELLEQNNIFDIAVVDDIAITQSEAEDGSVTGESVVSYVATVGVPQSAISFESTFVPEPAEVPLTAPTSTETASTSVDESVTSDNSPSV